MPDTSGNNKTNKNHRNANKNLRRLTEAEKKKKFAGSPPNPAKSAYNIVKTVVKAHTDLHKKSKGVRDATRSMKPGRKV
tara:strand:- start:667 stop:903 length:237 start_codon:yes stop_codon:yes gene_type:complete